MKRVLVLFETSWDRRQLEACRADWGERFEVLFGEPADADTPWDLDVVGFLEAEAERRRGGVQGVFSTSDYPGATLSAALAARLGLPGPAPESVLRASHKYLSRQVQREAVPEAVPGFARLDPHDPETWRPEFGFPCFVKPVKGAFSILSGVVRGPEELRDFLKAPRAEWFENVFLAMFDQLVRHFELDHDGRWFIAEELLRGRQVTVEGWRTGTDDGVLGVVDSTFRPGTKSFVRFDYPTSLPADVEQRARGIALAVSEALELEDTLFNVELTYDEETDALCIVEVNPRACGQFADLYHKVDGVSGYETALAVAAGEPPRVARREGACGAAASFPLRVFEPSRVVRVPSPEHVRRVEREHGALVWLECAAGDQLADFGKLEDGESARYGIVNVGGADADDVQTRFERLRADLDLVVEPLATA